MRSPCVNKCDYDPNLGLCLGCGRTLEEIGNWATMSDEERQELMAALPQRLELLCRTS